MLCVITSCAHDNKINNKVDEAIEKRYEIQLIEHHQMNL